uniref:Enteropeptidase-like n=1 Tax=Petromyzon marinus TaxID=7757 RepID=A0AAJ7TP30_PETMA|nr:enteropeptidase-like [Petromyzon marinus]
MEEVKGKRSSRWTSFEVTLIVFCALGTAVCAGLIAVAWLAIDGNSQLSPKDETNEISGKMKIVGGALYSPRLHDPTSTEFKILAFDVEHTINKVYSESSMKNDYAGCRVVAFEQGSVWVLLGLKFTLAMSEGLVGTAQETLLAAISPSTPVSNVGFLPPFEVDIASVQVYGDKPSIPTFKPTPAPNKTSAPTFKPTPAPNNTSTPSYKPTPAPNNTSAPTLTSTLVPVTSKESCGSVELWEPNTTFSSPNYPNNYSVNTLCFWFLRAQEGDNVQLHFQDFDTETHNDMVMVYDGNSTSAMLIGMFSGSGPGRDLFSTGSVMTVRFRSDFVTNSKGFLANFTTGFRLGMPPLCGNDESQCDNYQCVPSSAVCDGRPDCTDTSDEKHCGKAPLSHLLCGHHAPGGICNKRWERGPTHF